MSITIFSKKEHVVPSEILTREAFWERLNQQAAHKPYAEKCAAPVFAAATFGPGKSRKRNNIKSVNAIVLDIDEPMTVDEASALFERFQLRDFAYAMYTTYSSAADAYKLRIIIPLAVPVSPEKYEKERFAARFAQLLDVEIDSTCERSTQVYFVPSCPPGSEGNHSSAAVDGHLLEEADLPILKDRGRKPPKSKTSDDDPSDAQILADEIEKHVSNGVPIIYCGNKFWVYRDGVRVPRNAKWLEKYVYNDILGRSKSLNEVRAAISLLKVTGYTDTMSSPENVELANFAGRTVALRTSQFVKTSPNHNLTILIPHAFNPEAECPKFFEFLEQILENDADAEVKKLFLQQWFGYLLMPTAKFQIMLWLVGPGANGKSILTALMTRMLGCENTSAVPLSTFGTRFATADLFGKLANITDEAGADYYLNDNTIKEVVGGSRVRAEHKGQDAFSFEVFSRIVVSTNHLPRTKDTSHGYFRRIVILELGRIFSKAEQDPDLLEKLQEEMAGIVRFAVEGAGKLLCDGKFVDLPSSDGAIERYMADANPVRQFVAEALIPDAIDSVTGSRIRVLKIDLYALFKEYCQQRGNIAPSSSVFGKRLKELGLNDAKSCGKTYWLCGFSDPSAWLRMNTELETVLRQKIVLPDDKDVLPDNITSIKIGLPRALIPIDSEFDENYTTA